MSVASAELNNLNEKIIIDDLLAEKVKLRKLACSEICWIVY